MKLPKISFSKKIIFLVLIFLFLFLGAQHVIAYVPSEPYSEQFSTGLTGPSWEKSSFDFTTFNNILESISTSILGSDSPNVNIAMGGGFVEKTGNLIAAMYTNPPASSKEYLANLGDRLKVIKPTYAQGIGFEGLEPILPIWTAFRNLAYVFFTIVFIFTGFAIMFRLKINPQTVVTIQSALPKIIIALILVTFSYAIAGLLIDFIYVIISLIFASLSNLPDISSTMGKNIFVLAGEMFIGWGTVKSVFGSINIFTQDLFRNLTGAKEVLGWAVGGLGTAIIAVAIAFSVFKIFFTLLISYISIIAGVIFSPIMLMLEAIPGQKGLNNWLKLMISNIIPFPLVAAIFAIGSLLTKTVGGGEPLWVAPFIGMGTTAAIPVLIGVAIIIAAPTVISTVQKSIGAPGMAGMAAGVIQPLAAAGKFVATPITYPVSQAKVGLEKYHAEQVGRAYDQGGIRGALTQSFIPWRRVPEGTTEEKKGGGSTQAPPGSPTSA